MQRLIELVVKYKEFISFTMLVIISLSLISIGNVSQIGGFRTVVIGSIGWLQEIFSWIPNPGALQSENKVLRDLDLKLSSEVTRLRHSIIENRKLREMLELPERVDSVYIAAEIIGRTTIELRRYVTLNKGKSDGILQGMTVRAPSGLVGFIVGSSDNYSLVELIVNQNVRIAAKVQRTDITGMLFWEGSKSFSLKNIPDSYDIQVGDVIMTSNSSNKYPKDIPIGQIVNIEEDPGTLFLNIKVVPYVDFSSLEEIFVLKQLPDPERIKLIRDMEERLKARLGRP